MKEKYFINARVIDPSQNLDEVGGLIVDINGKINGLYPVPGAFFIYKGERYKILKAEIGNGIGNPGEVISDYLEVACGDRQSIKIKEIQREGKKVQNIGEFIIGSQIKKGITING